MATRVFVYGTLLPGEGNHELLRGARRVGPARTLPRYRLHDLGAYPALVAGGATAVVGEVWEVDDVTLAALDRLEDHPDYYRREPVALDGEAPAEGYLLPVAHVAGTPVIHAGDWCAHRRGRAA